MPETLTPLQEVIVLRDRRKRTLRRICEDAWEETRSLQGVTFALANIAGRPIAANTVRGWLDELGIGKEDPNGSA